MAPPASLSAEQFASVAFDYLIVGGGTAGLVVAARLSEHTGLNVGVLEAGSLPADRPEVTVPGRYGEGIGTDIDWQYETTPQRKLNGRRLPWPRGKALGGSSALNFMVWNRPNQADLDEWKRLGNAGWGWDEVLPFYKKTEHFTEPAEALAQQHHLYYDSEAVGKGGPLPITYMKDYSDSHQHWHETLARLGVETNRSHLSGSNVGAWTSVAAVDPKTMTRAWSTSAYYLPNAKRENLFVLTGANVVEIIIEDGADIPVAKGARFQHIDGEFVARASCEIILSAGSVASPQLLELSGIGSAAILESAGIPVKVANSNVGEHLQDHIMTATIYEVDPSVASPDDLKIDEKQRIAADELYQAQQTGPRTLLACSLAYVALEHFVPNDKLRSLADRIDTGTVQGRVCARRLAEPHNLGQIEYIFDIGNWSPFFTPELGKKYATLLQILQYPSSVGSIHINPRSPTGPPIIDPRYYEGEGGEVDLEIQRLCAHFGRRILDTPPLKSFVRKRIWPPEDATDDEANAWILANTITDWHPIGTCAMGGSEGMKAGVVDERLRVYGVRGLRVVDASIMPLQISAHLQATVYAIAEKASHMILEDRRLDGALGEKHMF